jgi:hypothetical protein
MSRSRRGEGRGRLARLRWAACLVAEIGVVALRLAAYATPPDPIEVQGWYDAADFDDQAQAILTWAGLAATPPPRITPPAPVGVEAPVAGIGAFDAPPFTESPPRAPPRS